MTTGAVTAGFAAAVACGGGATATPDSGPQAPAIATTAASGNAVVDAGSGTGSPAIDQTVAAGPRFGVQCATGVNYADSFIYDPSQNGWTPYLGSWTWDPTNGVYKGTTVVGQAGTWLGYRDSWKDYGVSAQIRVDGSLGDWATGGVTFRVQQPGTLVDGGVVPTVAGAKLYYVGVGTTEGLVSSLSDTTWTTLAKSTTSLAAVGTWHQLDVRVQGGAITASLDGQVFATVNDATFALGSVGLWTQDLTMSFNSVAVKCL